MCSILDKSCVESLYIQGYNAAEIAKELGSKRNTVNKCIQRNFQHLKSIHDSNKRYRQYHNKEVLKATNYEANKFMRDKTFILKNRSIYKTKENGDLVLRADLDCSVTWDTPRRLANEVI